MASSSVTIVGGRKNRAGQYVPSPHELPLTRQQLLILMMISDGLGDKQIAYYLELSTHTIKQHIKKGILPKLQAQNRAHAVGIAFNHGILKPHPRPKGSPRRPVTNR